MSRFHGIRLAPGVARRLTLGDRNAQESVYRAYSGAVYTMARRILRDRGLAEEVTQDTFVDVIEKADQLERPEALATWLRTIAVNHCLMRLRSPWQRRKANWEASDMGDAVDQVTVNGTEHAERAADIDAALAKLPADARMVVWMHCVEGFTHHEIGAAFGRTPSFSKSKLARAYQLLAAQTATPEHPRSEPDRRSHRKRGNEPASSRKVGDAAFCAL